MKFINLTTTHIFGAIFFLTLDAFSKVRSQSLKNTTSVPQHDIDVLHLHEVDYIWTVDRNYLYGIESPTFSAPTDDTFKWYLRFEPNIAGVEILFSLYLRLSSDSKKSKAWVLLDFNIWSDERRTKLAWHWKLSDSLREINANTTGLGPVINRLSKNMILNDKMFISCHIKYREDIPALSHPRQTTTTAPQPFAADNKFFDNLASLFKNEKLADIVLIINGTKYPAHKAILAARSPVFAAMFERGLKKGKTVKRLNITITNERAAVEMLRYIYTGKCENLPNTADQLLVAADKYGLDVLKMICGETLGKNLTVENAAKTLVLANKYGTAELKAKAIGFIVAKYIEVSNTTDWKRIAKKNSKLVHDVLAHVLLKNTPS